MHSVRNSSNEDNTDVGISVHSANSSSNSSNVPEINSAANPVKRELLVDDNESDADEEDDDPEYTCNICGVFTSTDIETVRDHVDAEHSDVIAFHNEIDADDAEEEEEADDPVGLGDRGHLDGDNSDQNVSPDSMHRWRVHVSSGGAAYQNIVDVRRTHQRAVNGSDVAKTRFGTDVTNRNRAVIDRQTRRAIEEKRHSQEKYQVIVLRRQRHLGRVKVEMGG